MASVILLTMSTLAGKLESKNFKVDGEEVEIKDCISQLEPVVRYYLQDQGCEKEVDILMLCTLETLFPARVDGKLKEYSAASYFKERIEKSPEKCEHTLRFDILPLFSVVPDKKNIEIKRDYWKPLTKEESIQNYQLNIYAGIAKAVDSIRSILSTGSSKASGSLYIVTHGGLRDIIISLNAIISLLDMEGIYPEKIMGTVVGENNIITDQSASFDIFQFVTGMRDFINFGHTEILENYYKKESRHLTGTNETAREKNESGILQAMKAVSQGLQFSNPRVYKAGLKQLMNQLNSKKEKNIWENNLLGIFEKNIKRDFGTLLKSKETSIIDIIERCICKKQFQQGLTFLESGLPQFYMDNELVFFDQCTVSQLHSRYAKTVDEKKEELFNKYVTSLRFKKRDVQKQAYEIVAKSRQGDKAGDEVWEKIQNPFVFYFKDGDRQPVKYTIKSRFSKKEFEQKVLPIVRMHRVLKLIRNGFSHAISRSPLEGEDLASYMEKYLTELKSLKKQK